MPLCVGLAQINPVVGGFETNLTLMREMYRRAIKRQVDLLVFPELCLCGYPPEDLLFKPHFLADTRDAIESFAGEVSGMTVLAGFAESGQGGVYNSMAVISEGRIEKIYRKISLPNYGVFDERRYFMAGREPLVIERKGLSILLTVCEDIWEPDWLSPFLAKTGAAVDLVVNISASPFNVGKLGQRKDAIQRFARRLGCAAAYCNLVGGQDELVFDGRSLFADSAGEIVCQGEAFEEDFLTARIEKTAGGVSAVCLFEQENEKDPWFGTDAPVSEVFHALVVGTRDYVRKNGFSKVLIGLSGGIDSSLTAAVAVEGLGAENVIGVTMPSRFNTRETIGDAERLARNLDIEFHSLAIADILDAFDNMLANVPGWDDKGLAYENLQARIRGTLLMSLSNQLGTMVLTTGNKSETAVGYSTLYGDTAGGFAVIRDVPKTMVYALCEYINRVKKSEIIPESVITRPPSAELRPDQKDSDSLPDYDMLDAILQGYVEQDLSLDQLIDKGLDADTVRKVITLVDRNEYKRRQSPPGVRITPRAFGKDRRMPITNRYRP